MGLFGGPLSPLVPLYHDFCLILGWDDDKVQ